VNKIIALIVILTILIGSLSGCALFQFGSKDTDSKIARSLVKTAVITAARISMEMKKLPLIEGVINTSREEINTRMLVQMKKRLEEINSNINTDIDTYYEILSSLISLNNNIVNNAFNWYNEYLNSPSRKHNAQWQINVFSFVNSHYSQYCNDRKGNINAWKNDFSQVKGAATEY